MDSAREATDAAREAPGTPPAQPRDLLDASTDAAAVVRADGVVLGWTRGAAALLGRPAADLVGRSAARLVAAPGDPARGTGVAAHCRAGTGWSGQLSVRHRDGRALDVDLRVSPTSGPGPPARSRPGGWRTSR
ncbi:hypothetical protein AQJ58_32915 [Streptomyces sp. DSM 15324]|nr:hypothetical protein AQJ58_32915 [Streptomyces sp. DSM 15324]